MDEFLLILEGGCGVTGLLTCCLLTEEADGGPGMAVAPLTGGVAVLDDDCDPPGAGRLILMEE